MGNQPASSLPIVGQKRLQSVIFSMFFTYIAVAGSRNADTSQAPTNGRNDPTRDRPNRRQSRTVRPAHTYNPGASTAVPSPGPPGSSSSVMYPSHRGCDSTLALISTSGATATESASWNLPRTDTSRSRTSGGDFSNWLIRTPVRFTRSLTQDLRKSGLVALGDGFAERDGTAGWQRPETAPAEKGRPAGVR